MERKAAVVTAEEVTTALGRVKTVTSEEEKALRMKYGSKVDIKAPLARAAEGNAELADELLVIEMQLLKAMKARQKVPSVLPMARNASKDKIVRALRKKK